VPEDVLALFDGSDAVRSIADCSGTNRDAALSRLAAVSLEFETRTQSGR